MLSCNVRGIPFTKCEKNTLFISVIFPFKLSAHGTIDDMTTVVLIRFK